MGEARDGRCRKAFWPKMNDCFRSVADIDPPCREAMGRWQREALTEGLRSEEHTSELQSLMRISYAVFCLKKKKKIHNNTKYTAITPTRHSHNRYKQKDN